MVHLFKKIFDARKDFTTYHIGLLQTKAYRAMKNKTAAVLKPYELSTVDWAFLGVLFEADGAMRSTEVAEELNVELPFISEISKKMEEKELIKFEKDGADARIKLLSLSNKGRKLVPNIEKVLREESKKWLVGVGVQDILTYVSVLKKIADGDKKVKTQLL